MLNYYIVPKKKNRKARKDPLVIPENHEEETVLY